MTNNHEGVSYETRGRIAIITLNVPDTLNALTQDLYFRLGQILEEIAQSKEVYVTILTGTGRFFSAGADITGLDEFTTSDTKQHLLQMVAANNLYVTRAFYKHPKILVTALNGPVIGLSAALIAHSDFIYATSHAYLLTPFSSLGLVCEGGSSHTFISKLGQAKANEALIMSRRIPSDELVQCGFVNKIFDGAEKGDVVGFMKKVLAEVDDRLGDHLNAESMVKIKEMMKGSDRSSLDAKNVIEVMEGLKRFINGIPQQEFMKLASGQKRHKL